MTIDAMGTQKKIAGAIRKKQADYLLALKGNQGTMYDDSLAWFADPVLLDSCQQHSQTNCGHGRIEKRVCYVADARWLAEHHPGWTDLRSIARIDVTRTLKKTGKTSTQTRYYISSLTPDPAHILNACRSHWSIENNLHWQLDVTFREDECRIRKDHSPRNLATIRRAVLNLLRKEPSKMSLKKKRLKASINVDFRTKILAC